MQDEPIRENQAAPNQDELDRTDLKQPSLTKDQALKWLSRAKTASKFHRKELVPKYKQAKRRYNSEIGYAGVNYSQNATRAKASHNDINLLFKDCKDFVSSIFYRNPQIELFSRSEDEAEIFNIQNLEQAVNDDITDRSSELKGIFRSILVDEYLSSVGALYIDYSYRDRKAVDESGNPMMENEVEALEPIENKVVITKIKPENLIRPQFIYYYNYHEAPYLGYVDIVPLDRLKNDSSLDQNVVGKIKGQEYKSLIDFDVKELDRTNIEDKDDLLHVKIYVIFIKGDDGEPIKRLILSDDSETRGEPLYYGDWDKGHGADDRGYPIHILELNDAADYFLPPSAAWILEPILQIIDHIFQKMNRHLKKSSTKTLIKTGEGGLEKPELDKWVRNNDLEILSVENLPPGIDINSIVTQLVDQPLSQDHDLMLQIARKLFDELSRKPSFSQASVINQKKTATESQAIQQVDNTENADYIDKFKDFLSDVFYDWAKLLQNNMIGPREITIEDETGNKINRGQVHREDMQGKFRVDINITSFIQPNKEVKRQLLKQTIADLTMFKPFLQEQGLQINAKKCTDELLENADVRNPQTLVIPMVVRDIDQQVNDLAFKGVPFNHQDLGGDKQKALNRLMQIFSDDQMMSVFEQMRPGIGAGNGPMASFAQFLEQDIQNTQKQSGGSQAKTDVGMNAAQMGAAQR